MRHQDCLYIHGVPVRLRHLPYGDLAVWHPFNERVREIVEPICRQRGRWQPDYRNWLVFRQFAAEVEMELIAAGERHA